jgi:hypothetical protein
MSCLLVTRVFVERMQHDANLLDTLSNRRHRFEVVRLLAALQREVAPPGRRLTPAPAT